MIKQEAARAQETEGGGDSTGKGHGPGPPGIAAFTGLLQALSERGSAVGASKANMGRSCAGGTSMQAGQSVRPSSVPSRARHQRGRASRTHSWGNRTNRSESSSRSSSKRSVGTSTVFIDRAELKKVNFVAASRPISPVRPDCGRLTGDTVLSQIRTSWIVQLENWWELEAVQPPLRWDTCLPRLRSRRFRCSRAGPGTWSSLRRKTQHVNCTRKATSDGWQACMHGIRSRRGAVTD